MPVPYRDRTPEHKARDRAHWAAVRKANRAAGLCRCGKGLEDSDRSSCRTCRLNQKRAKSRRILLRLNGGIAA